MWYYTRRLTEYCGILLFEYSAVGCPCACRPSSHKTSSANIYHTLRCVCCVTQRIIRPHQPPQTTSAQHRPGCIPTPTSPQPTIYLSIYLLITSRYISRHRRHHHSKITTITIIVRKSYEYNKNNVPEVGTYVHTPHTPCPPHSIIFLILFTKRSGRGGHYTTHHNNNIRKKK